MMKSGERGTGEPDPGKEMILTHGSGRAVRGGGDAHGLDCGRLTSGARVQDAHGLACGLREREGSWWAGHGRGLWAS